MRALAGVCCAGAIFALIGSATRAQDYNKTMTFTFNDSVQVPGVTLEPGTYTFKLADPDSGRRTVQVWNKDGSKMYTMALTTVDRRLDVADPTKIKDGLVMFGEQPAGTPMAIRTWFYTGDTIGYEFVYPKDQAMMIAKAYHTPVLASGDASSTDSAALSAAKLGRIDENGQFTDDATPSVTASAAASPDQPATTSTQSSTTASTTTASTASSNSTASAATTTGTTAPVESPTSTSTTASTTTADNAAPIPDASANRTPPASTVAASATDTSTTASTTTAAEPAPRAFDNTASVQEPQPVGTTGQATTARATDTAPQTAPANRTLPQTASPLATIALLSAMSLLSAVAMRQLRRRYSHSV